MAGSVGEGNLLAVEAELMIDRGGDDLRDERSC